MLSQDIPLWYAVQVMPHHEFKIADGLRIKGYDQFLPVIRARQTHANRQTQVQQALFAGYVFCRLQRTGFGSVLGMPGVYRIISFGGKAHPISESEITALRQITDSGREVSSIPFLSVGNQVEVRDGPLTGLRGIITRVKNRNRLIVSVQMLVRSVAVDVALSEVIPCNTEELTISSCALL
jgi:transcription antitermination factor NusG